MKLQINHQLSPAAGTGGSINFQPIQSRLDNTLTGEPAAFIMSKNRSGITVLQTQSATSKGHVWYDATVYPHWND